MTARSPIRIPARTSWPIKCASSTDESASAAFKAAMPRSSSFSSTDVMLSPTCGTLSTIGGSPANLTK